MTSGFLNQKQRHPVALAAALTINLGAVAALLLAKSGAIPLPPGAIPLIEIPITTPPPEVAQNPPKAEAPVKRTTVIPVDKPQPAHVDRGIDIAGTGTAAGGETTSGEQGVRTIVEPELKPPPAPVLTEASALARAARDFQPPYPSQLLRMRVEGKAVVRVLIGTDGRVKQVAIISADDPLFAEATETQALRKWRFRPATRDGEPVEAWKQMTVRFEIK